MKIFRKIHGWIIAALLLSPVVALAQAVLPPAPGGLRDLSNGQGPGGLLIAVIDMILLFAALVAVLFLIIGGYQYITSAGNEELAEHGKKTLQNSIIGLVIVILSYTIVSVIFRALSGSY